MVEIYGVAAEMTQDAGQPEVVGNHQDAVSGGDRSAVGQP